jgi:hypothetical protein
MGALVNRAAHDTVGEVWHDLKFAIGTVVLASVVAWLVASHTNVPGCLKHDLGSLRDLEPSTTGPTTSCCSIARSALSEFSD